MRKSVIKKYRIEEDSFGKLDEVFENYIKNKDTDNFLKELMEYSSYIKVKDFDDDTDILKDLRKRRIAVSETVKKDIADYNDFRKSIFGKIILTNEGKGMGIDEHYEELNSIRPDLFPSDIINPTDQLLHIVEVAESINKPYLLKDIMGQRELEDDIIIYAMDFIANNKILSNVVLGGNYGEETNVNEGHSTGVPKEGTKGRKRKTTADKTTPPNKNKNERKFYAKILQIQMFKIFLLKNY